MKSYFKLSLSITVCFLFFLIQIQAQKTSLSKSLIGEWTSQGSIKPKINLNDTITLTKQSLNNSDYTKWIFEAPNRLEIAYYFDLNKSGSTNASASNTTPSEWSYDYSSNLLRIHHDKSDQYFKIISNNDQIKKLICVK
jgi:hypothetical protein